MDVSIAVDGSDAHNLSIADTSSSGKLRRDFSLEEETALCNEIEEKKPMFNTAQLMDVDPKLARPTHTSCNGRLNRIDKVSSKVNDAAE
ncbi:hypothetical protein RvY_07880 [Ramazzottius varieornatus]|uniref:Uncharacterized protein n=1 Tax=Ramazzottius varieornatus TaxID=947166 RepID=A0A1D1V8Q8_RAMVA|nr:hypothetical protein RvY_07880 [Ramazzottius varieornatus]